MDLRFVDDLFFLDRQPITLVEECGELVVRGKCPPPWDVVSKQRRLAVSCGVPRRRHRAWYGRAWMADGMQLANVVMQGENDSEPLPDRHLRPYVSEHAARNVIHDNMCLCLVLDDATDARNRDCCALENDIQSERLGRCLRGVVTVLGNLANCSSSRPANEAVSVYSFLGGNRPRNGMNVTPQFIICEVVTI